MGRARTVPRMSPSLGSPERTTPCAPSSFTRCMNDSYMAREAPAWLRAMMNFTPTSRAYGRCSTSAASGLPELVATSS